MAQLMIEIEKVDWRRIIKKYLERIFHVFGDRLVGFLASYDPNVTVYDYNVVIVLADEPSGEDIKVARRLARTVEEELGLDVLIVPIVVKKGDIIEGEAYGTFNSGA